MNKNDLNNVNLNDTNKNYILKSVRVSNKAATFVLFISNEFCNGTFSEAQRKIIEFSMDNEDLIFEWLSNKKEEQEKNFDNEYKERMKKKLRDSKSRKTSAEKIYEKVENQVNDFNNKESLID